MTKQLRTGLNLDFGKILFDPAPCCDVSHLKGFRASVNGFGVDIRQV